MFKKLLVPVDGSDQSNIGVQLAVKMAAESDAEVLFAHVIDLSQAALLCYPGTAVPAPLDGFREAGQQVLDDASAFAEKATVTCSQALVEGQRLEALLELIDKHGIDLVVIGSHGRGGIYRAFLGSTAEGILRHASVPVLVTTPKRVAAAKT